MSLRHGRPPQGEPTGRDHDPLALRLTILPPGLPPTTLRDGIREDRNKPLTWEPPYGIEP